MDARTLFETSARGIHLLFDTPTIAEAFGEEPKALRRTVEQRFPEIRYVVHHLLALPSAVDGREFIAGLPRDLRCVIVLLYFELLDDRLRRSPLRH
jgi:hypothetical protein